MTLLLWECTGAHARYGLGIRLPSCGAIYAHLGRLLLYRREPIVLPTRVRIGHMLCAGFLADALLVQRHDLDEPLRALVPPSELGLTEGCAARGVLGVNEVRAGPARTLDEGTGGGELAIERGPVEGCALCSVGRREEGGGVIEEGEEVCEDVCRGLGRSAGWVGEEGDWRRSSPT